MHARTTAKREREISEHCCNSEIRWARGQANERVRAREAGREGERAGNSTAALLKG